MHLRIEKLRSLQALLNSPTLASMRWLYAPYGHLMRRALLIYAMYHHVDLLRSWGLSRCISLTSIHTHALEQSHSVKHLCLICGRTAHCFLHCRGSHCNCVLYLHKELVLASHLVSSSDGNKSVGFSSTILDEATTTMFGCRIVRYEWLEATPR